MAKTLPVVGGLSAGYFFGNKKVLVTDEKDASGNLSPTRRASSCPGTAPVSEISDKVWVGMDYQGGNSALGALSFGVSYAFAKNVSVILGYDISTTRTWRGRTPPRSRWTSTSRDPDPDRRAGEGSLVIAGSAA